MNTFGLFSDDPIKPCVRDFVSAMKIPKNLISPRAYAESLAADLAREGKPASYLERVFRKLRTTEDELPSIAEVMRTVRNQEFMAEWEAAQMNAQRATGGARLAPVPPQGAA